MIRARGAFADAVLLAEGRDPILIPKDERRCRLLTRASDLAVEYELLKVRLAREHPFDVGEYTAGKRDFVIRVLADAGIHLGGR